MKSSQKSVKIKINQENYKNEDLINEVEESEDDNSTSKNLDDNDIISENPEIKKHQRCVPLEIYTKVYKDKQTLLSQIAILNEELNSLNNNKTNKIIKDQNEELKLLDNKCKNLQREKTNIENILLNQENYVDKLKKKIEKLENEIAQKNEEILLKDNNIMELTDKLEELNDKINTMKQTFKINEKKEIMKLNDKILSLVNEVELKQHKIDFISKRHKHLQIKYLKLLGDKKKIPQDLLPVFKPTKDKEIFSEVNSTTGSKHIETIKSYNSIKKTDNINKNNKLKVKKEFSSLNIKLYKELYLPDIKKRGKNEQFLIKDNNLKTLRNKKHNGIKDINYIFSDESEEKDDIKYKNEELEEEEETI